MPKELTTLEQGFNCEIQKISRMGTCTRPAAKSYAGVLVCDNPEHAEFAERFENFSDAFDRSP